jgi:hypothetical protein
MRVILIIVGFLFGGPALSAPALTGQTCLIRGEVLDISAREVSRDTD